ncbi:MAG: 6-phosphogluconolactonase, partial [Verrucomicrobia bacterium]|nr:6-phosphogluconolactonase [Verrucomicrobiota bacterium]
MTLKNKNVSVSPQTSTAAMALEAARIWFDQLETRESDKFLVALSGGRSAALLFNAIAELALENPPTLTKIHFFWADERCVPPAHAESNFALAYENLLAPLAIPENLIHRIHGEDPPENAAADIASVLSGTAGAGKGQIPVLDFVFLGMGEDGHIASLFPDAPEAARSQSHIYLPVKAPKPPPQRITLTYPVLAAAATACVLVTGKQKKAA